MAAGDTATFGHRTPANAIATHEISIVANVCLHGVWVARTQPAFAVEVAIGSAIHGPDNCQAALPVFDGNIRKRPRAIANEGTAIAFITCDFEASPTALRKVLSVIVRFHNASAAAQSVSCTLVDAFGAEVFSANSIKAVDVAAGANAELRWVATLDNGNVTTRRQR